MNYITIKITKAFFTYTSLVLSAAVVTGGGTGTGSTTPTKPTTPVFTPTKPTAGSCQKSESPHEKKSEKKRTPKPAPIKSAALACKK